MAGKKKTSKNGGTSRKPVIAEEEIVTLGEVTPEYGREYFSAYDAEEPEEEEEEVYFPLPEYDPAIRYAGFQHRLLATIMDLSLVMLLMVMVVQPLLQWIGVALPIDKISDKGQFYRQILLVNGLQVVLYVFYCLFCWLKWGTTPGKFVMGLKIANAVTGENPSRIQWFIRTAFYPVSGMACMLGFLWILLHRRKQGWHDRAAHTVVLVDKSLYLALWRWVRGQWSAIFARK